MAKLSESTMATVMREMNKKLKSDGKNEALGESVTKICTIDLAFIEQAYVEVCASAVLQKTGWTAKLFKRLISTGTGVI